MDGNTLHTARTCVRLQQTGARSARETVEMFLDRARTFEPRLHAYALLSADAAREQADRVDRERKAGLDRGPLHGAPIAIKDLIATENEPTACGTTFMADRITERDATVVARLRQAGAIIIGKTRMTEGATILHHPELPTPVNPWHAGACSGFSSSGSGVAVAAGLCCATLGSDTGGSIRIPSAMNGITGLKPTWGRVSRDGVYPLVEYLDVIGPMAGSVEDCAAMLTAIAGPDVRDPTSHPLGSPNYLNGIESGISGLKIGIDRQTHDRRCDSAVADTMNAAATVFESLGARLIPVEYPEPDVGPLMNLVWAGIADTHRDTYQSHAAQYGPSLARLIEMGNSLSGADLAHSMNVANVLRGKWRRLFEDVDLMLIPALPIITPDVGVAESGAGQSGTGIGFFTQPLNVTGNPTLTFPGQPDGRGMPVGVQLVARHFAEPSLFRAGYAFQRATDWHLLRPTLDC